MPKTAEYPSMSGTFEKSSSRSNRIVLDSICRSMAGSEYHPNLFRAMEQMFLRDGCWGMRRSKRSRDGEYVQPITVAHLEEPATIPLRRPVNNFLVGATLYSLALSYYLANTTVHGS